MFQKLKVEEIIMEKTRKKNIEDYVLLIIFMACVFSFITINMVILINGRDINESLCRQVCHSENLTYVEHINSTNCRCATDDDLIVYKSKAKFREERTRGWK